MTKTGKSKEKTFGTEGEEAATSLPTDQVTHKPRTLADNSFIYIHFLSTSHFSFFPILINKYIFYYFLHL